MLKAARELGKSVADTLVVIPAKAGIQRFLRLMDSGSSLHCGRNDDFLWQEAFSAAC
jgi:hypothetical protein